MKFYYTGNLGEKRDELETYLGRQYFKYVTEDAYSTTDIVVHAQEQILHRVNEIKNINKAIRLSYESKEGTHEPSLICLGETKEICLLADLCAFLSNVDYQVKDDALVIFKWQFPISELITFFNVFLKLNKEEN